MLRVAPIKGGTHRHPSRDTAVIAKGGTNKPPRRGDLTRMTMVQWGTWHLSIDCRLCKWIGTRVNCQKAIESDYRENIDCRLCKWIGTRVNCQKAIESDYREKT